MTSVFRMHPDDLKKKMDFIGLNKNNNNTLNFLDNIKKKYFIDVEIYYKIINSIEEYKLKNIFYFINLRIKKIDLKIHYENVNNDNINEIFNNFIDVDKDKSIVKSIMIMNMLQHYIYPLK